MIAFALALALQSPAPAVRATAACTPAEVDIGEPIECSLEVVHPAQATVRVKTDELALDDSWLVLEEGRILTTDGPEGARTRARWVVASLEPGERRIALPPARYELDGVSRTATAEEAVVRVRAALGDGEDAPRPAHGFRPPPTDPGPRVPRVWVAGALGACLAAGLSLYFVARARRGREPLASEPGPLKLLARWSGSDLADPAALRALHFELSQLVRAAADERTGAGERHAGLTDEEWLARAAGAPGSRRETHEAVAALLTACARVKYGQELPTRWAAEELLGRARALIEQLTAPAAAESGEAAE